jgi:hypothetical protein
MRGASLALGTLITLTIAAAAQAAMAADMQAAASRAAQRESAVHQALDPVWFGGELPPVVVEVVPSRVPAATARMVPPHRAASRASRGTAARIS